MVASDGQLRTRPLAIAGVLLLVGALQTALVPSPAMGVASPCGAAGQLTASAECTYLSTASEDVFLVPRGATSLHVDLVGGRGGTGGAEVNGLAGGVGGFGDHVVADLPVTTDVLYVHVAGNGGNGRLGGYPGEGRAGAGGSNGGAGGGRGELQEGGPYPYNGGGGGGGGGSDLRTVSSPRTGSVASRLVVAGGGGGGGAGGVDSIAIGARGGDAGFDGATGATQWCCAAGPGRKGTLTEAGEGGTVGGEAFVHRNGAAGAGSQGGTGGGARASGGGGGGGYFGGGGGAGGVNDGGSGGGGGGASSYVTGAASNPVVTTDGTGTPLVRITWTPTDPGSTVDVDGDSRLDVDDNCFRTPNAAQADADGDGVGDACDPDDDNDGVSNAHDEYPSNAAESVDTDHDGVGDNADTDDDDDGHPDAGDDFPRDPAESIDSDHDGVGNIEDGDDDDDGFPDFQDQLPLDPTESRDRDGDGIGDNADPDDDNDGTPDLSDNCPVTANADQANFDGDTRGDACDPNDDNDAQGDTADPDDDNDGIYDTVDYLPLAADGRFSDGTTTGVVTSVDSSVTMLLRNHTDPLLGVTLDLSGAAKKNAVRLQLAGQHGTSTFDAPGSYVLTAGSIDLATVSGEATIEVDLPGATPALVVVGAGERAHVVENGDGSLLVDAAVDSTGPLEVRFLLDGAPVSVHVGAGGGAAFTSSGAVLVVEETAGEVTLNGQPLSRDQPTSIVVGALTGKLTVKQGAFTFSGLFVPGSAVDLAADHVTLDVGPYRFAVGPLVSARNGVSGFSGTIGGVAVTVQAKRLKGGAIEIKASGKPVVGVSGNSPVSVAIGNDVGSR